MRILPIPTWGKRPQVNADHWLVQITQAFKKKSISKSGCTLKKVESVCWRCHILLLAFKWKTGKLNVIASVQYNVSPVTQCLTSRKLEMSQFRLNMPSHVHCLSEQQRRDTEVSLLTIETESEPSRNFNTQASHWGQQAKRQSSRWSHFLDHDSRTENEPFQKFFSPTSNWSTQTHQKRRKPK